MSMPPKYSTFCPIEDKEVKFESTLCSTKLRYGRSFRGTPLEQQEEAEKLKMLTEEELWEEQVQENTHLETYDPVRKSLDFRKLKAKGMRENPRVFLPRPRPLKEEVVIQAKEIYWQWTNIKNKIVITKGTRRRATSRKI